MCSDTLVFVVDYVLARVNSFAGAVLVVLGYRMFSIAAVRAALLSRIAGAPIAIGAATYLIGALMVGLLCP
jgi:hypothetical protein